MMPPRRQDGVILAILVASILAVYAALQIFTSLIASEPSKRNWVSYLAALKYPIVHFFCSCDAD